MIKFFYRFIILTIVWSGVSAPAQYLYLMQCNFVSKVDANTGKWLSTIELSKRTDLIPDESPRTAFCDLDGMSYDSGRHVAIVDVNDRTHKKYRRLEFSIPGFRFLRGEALKDTWHDDGDIESENSSQEEEVQEPKLQGMAAGGSEKGWLDLRTYRSNSDLKACTAYEQGKTLLSEPIAVVKNIFVMNVTCSEGTRFFSIDADSHQITRLELPATAATGRFFTTEDGKYLLATGRADFVKVDGDVTWLVDLHSGRLVQQWHDKRFIEASFVAFVPHNRLLFLHDDGNILLDTKVTFPPSTHDGGAFLADR